MVLQFRSRTSIRTGRMRDRTAAPLMTPSASHRETRETLQKMSACSPPATRLGAIVILSDSRAQLAANMP